VSQTHSSTVSAAKGDTRTGRQLADAASDAALVAAMVENGDALEALLDRYARLVFRIAADILRDAAEAEDVTQEVFLDVYRNRHLYDPDRGSVKVWLMQYAYHRTFRRKAALRRRAWYTAESLDEVAVEAVCHDRRGGLTREECLWVLRAGLAQLPERQRTTLELACFEELSLRDVAARLRVSLGCARHYYYRGLARLRAWARLPGVWQSAPSLSPGAGRARIDS
jgi:RNA polymerase sigma-70 factor (ECF subfamily)